ncbi:RES family NAD+ phosphorylase [Nonlabens tegetincola]
MPLRPPETFVTEAAHLRGFDSVLWRVFATTSPHALRWNELRRFGPIAGMRFDPHKLPQGMDSQAGVMYAATTPHTALAETFQATRVIDRSLFGREIVAWRPTRALTLLDLTTNWPVLNGAAASMMMDDKVATAAWARAIHSAMGGEIDGLFHHSSITAEPVVTLFGGGRREPGLPKRPEFSAPLGAALADEIVSQASRRLGYRVV